MTEERAASDRKGAFPFGAVSVVFVALLAVGLGLGLYIHQRFVKFPRVVAHHVPADATFALRWDVEKVTLFEPTRAYLVPLVELKDAGKPAPKRRGRFEVASGENLGRELRELLVVAGPGGDDWAVVTGAAFGSGAFPAALELLRTEGWKATASAEVQHGSGLTLTRASDGAIVLASNAAYGSKVRRDHPERSEIPRTGALSLFARSDRGELPRPVAALLQELGGVRELRATGQWANPFPLDVRLEYAAEPPADAAARIDAALARLLGVDLEDAGTLARDVQPAGNRALRFRWLLEGPDLELLSRRCAQWVSGVPIDPLSSR
jgi:hypothetical protein